MRVPQRHIQHPAIAVRLLGKPLQPAGGKIEVQNRAASDQPWQTVATVDLNARGHFLKTFPARPGSWRLVWTPTVGTTYVSREAVARKR